MRKSEVKEHAGRIKNVLAKMKSLSPRSVMIVGSSIAPLRSGDQHYHFEQNRDFYYLTGIDAPNHALILDPEGSSIVISLKQSKLQKIWDGVQKSQKKYVTSLGLLHQEVDDFLPYFLKIAKGKCTLFYQSERDTVGNLPARHIFSLQLPEKRGYPSSFIDLQNILSSLREVKSPHEVSLIKKAIEITHKGLNEIVGAFAGKPTEVDLANIFESTVLRNGGRLAFHTIAAYGKNGAGLHHTPKEISPLKNDLVLLDLGASWKNYSADITRTLPFSGKFSSPLKDAYLAVLSANKAAIKAVKAGVSKEALNQIAVRELAYGLKQLGLVSGSVSQIVSSGSYREFYPHSLGHSLGLDTHDVGELRENSKSVYRQGMVVTIEPGLYLRTRRKSVPPFGIRIEDNILVTKTGCEVLSPAIPKETEEVENWVQGIISR